MAFKRLFKFHPRITGRVSCGPAGCGNFHETKKTRASISTLQIGGIEVKKAPKSKSRSSSLRSRSRARNIFRTGKNIKKAGHNVDQLNRLSAAIHRDVEGYKITCNAI
jgi:hypothetical protein